MHVIASGNVDKVQIQIYFFFPTKSIKIKVKYLLH